MKNNQLTPQLIRITLPVGLPIIYHTNYSEIVRPVNYKKTHALHTTCVRFVSFLFSRMDYAQHS
jgi:hypothetical protein